MRATLFLNGVLLVGLIPLVRFSSASAMKGTTNVKDKTLNKQVSSNFNSSFSPQTMPPSARGCKRSKKGAKIQSTTRPPPLRASNRPATGSGTSYNTSSIRTTIRATQTTWKQATPAISPTTYLAGLLNAKASKNSRKDKRDKAVVSRSASQDNPCLAWMNCPVHHHPKIKAWFLGLPACPCTFIPVTLYDNNTIYDKIQGRLFSWRIANAKYEMLNVYKPTANLCIRQLPDAVSTTPATQVCCYDTKNQLITRGSGAGTPNLVAPELDYNMHSKVDLKPYISCLGDWTRYQAIRNPNNGHNCTDNPDKEEYTRQKEKAREI